MKENPFKRSVATLLVIALLMTLFPTSALAFSGAIDNAEIGLHRILGRLEMVCKLRGTISMKMVHQLSHW